MGTNRALVAKVLVGARWRRAVVGHLVELQRQTRPLHHPGKRHFDCILSRMLTGSVVTVLCVIRYLVAFHPGA